MTVRIFKNNELLACCVFPWSLGERPYLGVVVKIGLRLVPDGVAVPSRPVPGLHPHDVYHPEHPTWGVVAASDHAPHRPQADVTIPRAFSFAEESASERQVRLVVEQQGRRPIDKQLVVTAVGDGPVELTWAITHTGDENPELGRKPVVRVTDPRRPGEPASFGLVSRHARVRKGFAPFGPRTDGVGRLQLPDPFDWRYFQVSPSDQRLPRVVGEERITMQGLHPEHPTLVCRLPRLEPVAELLVGEVAQPVSLAADELALRPHALEGTLTWHAAVEVGDDHPADARVYVRLGSSPLLIETGADAEEPLHSSRFEQTSESDRSGAMSLPFSTGDMNRTLDRPQGQSPAPSPFPLIAAGRASHGRGVVPGAPWAPSTVSASVAPPSGLGETYSAPSLAAAEERGAAESATGTSLRAQGPSPIPPAVREPVVRVIPAVAHPEAEPVARRGGTRNDHPSPPTEATEAPPAAPVRPPVKDLVAEIYGTFK